MITGIELLSSSPCSSSQSDFHNKVMKASKRFKADDRFDSIVSSVENACTYIDDTMTAKSIQSLFSLLRKTIEKNAIERTRYAQTPSKFMDSEVALHQKLIKWKGVAAFPNSCAHCLEIKDDFVPLLLQHENIDIHYDVITIIADWTDIEMAEDELEAIAAIAKAFVEENVLTSLVQILERFGKVDVAEINNEENMEQDDQEDKEHETPRIIYHIDYKFLRIWLK